MMRFHFFVFLWAVALVRWVPIPAGFAADTAAADNTAKSPAKVDQTTLELARTLFESGKFVESEKLLRQVLAAIDAGQMPASQLGRCLGPLANIYRAWGRNDDALKIALRYRKYIGDLSALDTPTRNQLLDQNAGDLADILTALDRPAEAEQYLQATLTEAEKHTDANPQRTLTVLVKLAQLADAQNDHDKAQPRWQRVVEVGTAAAKKIEQRQLPAELYPDCLLDLAAGYVAVDNRPEAIQVLTRLLSHQTTRRDPAFQEAAAALKTRLLLGSLCAESGQLDQALHVFQDALAAQPQLATGAVAEADVLSRMAAVYKAQGLETEARDHWDQAAAIYAKAIEQAEKLPDSQVPVMGLLNQLQIVQQQARHYPEAIQSGRRLLELREKTLGQEHPLTFAAKSDLGAVYSAAQYYDLAKPLLTDALAYWQKHTPPAPLQLARALNDLAVAERGVGSLNEAKTLFQQALDLRLQHLSPDDPRLALTYANLASVFLDKGEYARAVVLFDQAIDIYRAHGTSDREALSGTLLNEAMVFKSQGQLAKAADYCRDSLQVYQQAFGSDAPGAVAHFNALTSLCIGQGQLAEAADYNRRAWQLCQQHHLDHEPGAATTLHHKATLEYLHDQFDAAQRDWRAALEIQQTAGQTEQAARTLNYLAKVDSLRGKPAEAEPLYRRALALQGSAHAYPTTYYLTSCNLAEILHDEGQPDEAIGLLQDAVKVIETPRAGTVGGEGERAEYFAQFASAFDLLVQWNLEQGHVNEAFAFAEQGRNRTFLDQLSLAGVDLRDTLSGPAGEKLRERERTLRTKLGTLRAEAVAITEKNPTAGSKSNPALDKLAQELDRTQSEYAQVWTDIRNASPYYRQQLSRDVDPAGSLVVVRSLLDQMHSLMLFYYVGDKKSFLLVIDPADEKVQVVPLEIPTALADGMSVKPGPLTRPAVVQLVNQFLADVRDRAGGRGLAGTVHSVKGVMATDQGTVLAEVLVPRSVRNLVEHRAPASVIIVPDGALHGLPFEALLLESQPAAKYLLDVFPPIAYAPSANILVNLIQRPATDANAMATLTVGNPKYVESATVATNLRQSSDRGDTAKNDPPTKSNSTAEHSLATVSRAAYLGLGGQLPPLPATAKECQRVAQAFQGGKVTMLLAEEATEQNVRAHIAGCRFIHIAAHGLVDQQHDNLFGAIALTPPTDGSESSDNDGFLSLHEIHELPLSGCQLAVLSACSTNVGPDRPLEAGSTLAQAFLAAGARRAVCSHWNVDDASTAELIGGFFERIAKAAQQTDAPGEGPSKENVATKTDPASVISYAQALYDARVKVRSQPQWSSPYYWAPFVLIGPPQ